MSFKITVRKVGDVSIIDSAGRITLGEGAGSLRETIRNLAHKGEKNVLLNLRETSYMDSSGFGELVSGFTKLGNQGATLKLLALNKRIKDLLTQTKLYNVFDIFEDESEAIQSFH